MNFGMNQPMIIKQNLRKYFIDGMAMKSQVMVKMTDGSTRVYEILAFRSIYARNFVIWTIGIVSLPVFEKPCSVEKTCGQCADKSYRLSGGVCLLAISSCVEYVIDVASDTLKCTNCAVGSQLLDQKCIRREYYPELFA